MSTRITHLRRDNGEVFDTFDVYSDPCGSDVCINLRRSMPFSTFSADPRFISIDLSPDEADALADALKAKAAESRQFDIDVNEYFENERRNPIWQWTSACYKNDVEF